MILLTVAVVLMVALVVFPKWRTASNNGGQQPVEPFRIAGNLYYVGANDVTAFLLTGPEGHVLIDGGYPGTAPLIMRSIARLGFDIRDVEVLLNSHAHFDHAGGLAELQRASGAKLWISELDAAVVAAGGAGDPSLGPLRALSFMPGLHYPAPRVDRTFRDGDTIRLGPIALTAHITPGHTPGCTSWSFPVRHGNRTLLAVHACSLDLSPDAQLASPETAARLRADFEHSFATLRSLPADIFITSHGRHFGRYRKFSQQAAATDPADPFIDRAGYLAFIDQAEARLRRELADRAPGS